MSGPSATGYGATSYTPYAGALQHTYLQRPCDGETGELVTHGNQDGYGEVVTVQNMRGGAHTVEVDGAKDVGT